MSSDTPYTPKRGEQIVCTQQRRFPPHISSDISQRCGDVIMVNNPDAGDSVLGVAMHTMGESNGMGFCSSFRVGTFRKATVWDAGYRATLPEWEATRGVFQRSAIMALVGLSLFNSGVSIMTTLGVL